MSTPPRLIKISSNPIENSSSPHKNLFRSEQATPILFPNTSTMRYTPTTQARVCAEDEFDFSSFGSLSSMSSSWISSSVGADSFYDSYNVEETGVNESPFDSACNQGGSFPRKPSRRKTPTRLPAFEEGEEESHDHTATPTASPTPTVSRNTKKGLLLRESSFDNMFTDTSLPRDFSHGPAMPRRMPTLQDIPQETELRHGPTMPRRMPTLQDIPQETELRH